jgi:hypothetical protein
LPNQIVFLFGAGASKGATHVLPDVPPLMYQLYDRLAVFDPDNWGLGSQMARYEDDFRKDFEKTFSERVLSFDGVPRGSSLDLLEHQRPLALYFALFLLDTSGRDYYSLLLKSLQRAHRLEQCCFGSLNYDCLFEQAAERLGINIDYDCIEAKSARIAKLHGSCNFITAALTQRDRAMMASPGTHYEIPLHILPVTNLEKTLNESLLGTGSRHLPVMSQISPDKQHFVAPAQIQSIRNKWAEAVSNAATVAIIGISCNRNDFHIVQTIRNTGAQILFIGDCENFQKWKRVNRNCVP